MVTESQKRQIMKKKHVLKKKATLKKNVKSGIQSKPKTNSNTKSFQLNASELNWKPVEIPDTLDDFEGFYGLEEIDNVDVQIVDGHVKFITKDEKNTITKEEASKKEKSIPEGHFELDAEDMEHIENENGVDSDEEEEEVEDKAEQEAEEEEDEEGEEEEEKDEEGEEKDEEEEEEQSLEDDISTKQQALSENSDNNEEKKETPQKKSRKEIKVTQLIASKDENDEENVPALKLEVKPTAHVKKEKVKTVQNENELKENTFAKISDISIPADDVDLPEWSETQLSASTLNGLQSLGFTKPTEIQKKTIPISIEGKDVIGKAITGSGKTLAYGIPILEKALNEQESSKKLPEEYRKHPTAIIFTPTRELANQVMKHLRDLFKYSPFSDKTVTSLTGGLSIQKQERLLSYGPKVLVATPGRCLELLEKSTSLARQIASIDILVLDEADRLLQDGHFDEFKKILEILQNYRPRDIPTFQRRWQSLIFSATFSKALFGKLTSTGKPANSKKRKNDDEESDIKEVLEILGKKLRFRGKPAYIDVNPTEVVANQITEAMIPCAPMERDLMLYYFVSIFPGTTIVFTNSIDSVKRLAPTLNYLGIPTVSIHSSMVQKQRLRALERFAKNSEIAKKEHKSSVLIASDVAARGLDIQGIQHVIHYHLPRTADTYVHRSGRTARAGSEGVSVVLCSPQEASGPLRKLRSALSKNDKVKDLRSLTIDTDIMEQLKERLDLAAKIAQAEVASQGVQKEKSWIEKAAEELGVDDIDEFEDDFLKRDRKRREGKTLDKQNLKVYKAQLRDLLKNPIRKSGRRSYIAGGLNNIAQVLLKNQNKDNVMGYLQQDALEVLKDKKKNKKQKI